MDRIGIIGAPSSAGAYAPGQERAPRGLRERGLDVLDLGDTPGFHWHPDPGNPRAMHVAAVARTARGTAALVGRALMDERVALVLGGDCTVELGTVAGALRCAGDLGLLYIDLDTDLNTPGTTTDGALDWMGVAHLLGVPGCVDELMHIGPRAPLLQPHQLHYFAVGNVEPCERELIRELGIRSLPSSEVAGDPARAARRVLEGWAQSFDRLLIHLDVDVLDFADMPLAENTRRNVGLKFDQLVAALGVALAAPNLAALTICEVNPDHGAGDGSTLQAFVAALSDLLASVGRQ